MPKQNSTEKKSKLYAGVFERKDGILELRFTVNGHRYSVYAKTLTELKKKETARRMEIEAGIKKPVKEQSFDDYFKDWLQFKDGTVKETTIRNYRMFANVISRTVIDDAGTTFGSLKMSKVEPQHVRDLQSAMKKNQHTRTINDSISLVKSVFNTAMNDHAITWNPAAGIKPLKRTEPAARDTIHRALSAEETKRFLEAASGSWYYELYVFLANTGCRIGEAAAIQQKDISGKTVHVNKTVTRTINGGYIIGKETKTKSGTRTIPLNNAALEAIAAQRFKNNALHGEQVTGIDETLFKALRGGLVKDSLVNEDIRRICDKAGLDRFSVHAFRDSFATRCVESGMQPKTLQDLMGHSDINMTMNLYAHVMDETKERQFQAVSFY